MFGINLFGSDYRCWASLLDKRFTFRTQGCALCWYVSGRGPLLFLADRRNLALLAVILC